VFDVAERLGSVGSPERKSEHGNGRGKGVSDKHGKPEQCGALIFPQFRLLRQSTKLATKRDANLIS
jgi:hypothetical protein